MSSSPRGGLVRQARRPEGWTPPGPEPVGPGDRDDLWPAKGEDLCFLTGHWRIFQRLKGHRYSVDDLMTAWYAVEQVRQRPPALAADIGCGIGSVLMMTAWRLQQTRFIGVEAQDISVDLAWRSIAYNGIGDRVEARHGDLRDASIIPEGPVFDLVTGTPPYIPVGDGIMSEREQCGPCRFELRGGIEDYCLSAARLLAPGGQFVACHAAAQRPRVEAAARAAGLVVSRLREVVPRGGRSPLFTVFCMVLADDPSAPAETLVEPPFLVRDAEGSRTEEYLAVRRDMGMP